MCLLPSKVKVGVIIRRITNIGLFSKQRTLFQISLPSPSHTSVRRLSSKSETLSRSEHFFQEHVSLLQNQDIDKVLFSPTTSKVYDALSIDMIRYYKKQTSCQLSTAISREERLKLFSLLPHFGLNVAEKYPVLLDIFFTFLPKSQYFAESSSAVYNIITREYDMAIKNAYIDAYASHKASPTTQSESSSEMNNTITTRNRKTNCASASLLPTITPIPNQHRSDTLSEEKVKKYRENQQNLDFLEEYFEKMQEEVEYLETQRDNVITQVNYNFETHNSIINSGGEVRSAVKCDSGNSIDSALETRFFNNLLDFARHNKALWLLRDILSPNSISATQQNSINRCENISSQPSQQQSLESSSSLLQLIGSHGIFSPIPWLNNSKISNFLVAYLLELYKSNGNIDSNSSSSNQTVNTVVLHSLLTHEKLFINRNELTVHPISNAVLTAIGLLFATKLHSGSTSDITTRRTISLCFEPVDRNSANWDIVSTARSDENDCLDVDCCEEVVVTPLKT